MVYHNGINILLQGSVSVASGIHCTPSVALGKQDLVKWNGIKLIEKGSPWTTHPHTPSDCDDTPSLVQGCANTNCYINGIRVARAGNKLSCGATTACSRKH